MTPELNEHILTLAEFYRLHFEAKNLTDSGDALNSAEAFQKSLIKKFGKDYAKQVDQAAYALAHG